MAYIGQSIKNGTFSVLDTSGNTYNGSNTTFSLGTQVGAAAQLLVSHDGVIQKPGTDYTLATGGTQITFTTAPASGASIFIVEISGAVGGPMNRDINGEELILDVDGDTSITADTDDQIDVKVGGTDQFSIKNGSVDFNDNVKARFGTGNDLEIYHDGSNSIIKDGGTGNINILADDFKVMNSAGDENIMFGAEDGTVRLFHNNVTKFETTSGGVAVTGALTATGDITAFYTSDKTLKTNIENIPNPIDKVMELNGVYYNWTQEAQDKYDHLGEEKEVGVIAQQVEKVLPELVGTRDDGTKAVRYERICSLLIECVKDLQEQVNELKKDR